MIEITFLKYRYTCIPRHWDTSDRKLIIMRRIVLFCSDVYTSLGVIRSVGEEGSKVEVFCYGEDCEYLLASKYVSYGKSFKNQEQVVNYLITEYPNYQEKPVLLTIPDPPAYLVDKHKDMLEKKFVLMSAGKSGNVIHWMSKINIGELAIKHGLTIPWTIIQDKNEAIPDDISYPVFTKSIKTIDGGKGDESICWSKSELEERAKTIIGDKFLVMKYVEKVKEINYFGLALDGHIYIDYHDERSRFNAGSYGHYNKFFQNGEGNNALLNMITSMMKETHYNGLFDVEFIQGRDGINYFLEVNFRVDGAIYKLTPGVNLPMEWIRLIGLKEAGLSLPQTLNMRKKYFTGMSECHDFRENVMTGKINFIVWLYQFLKTDKHMLLNLKDPFPLFVKCYYRLKQKIKLL